MTRQATLALHGNAAQFSLRNYVGLMRRWVRHDFDARYMRSLLSVGWAIVQPIAAITVYVFIFGVIFDQNGGDIPYLTYLLSGFVIFSIVTRALSLNTCIADNYGIISHTVFPREIIPLAQFFGASVDSLVIIPLFLIIAMIQGTELSYTVVFLPVVILSVVMLSAGVCVLVSTVQVFVRDLRFLIVPISQALFFASPISYTTDQLPAAMQWINVVNPISVDIEALRDVVLEGQWPQWPLFTVHLVLAAGLLVASIAHLRAVQHRIVDLA